MVPICIPTNNRVRYLKETLEHLRVAERREEFKIITADEPPATDLDHIWEDCRKWIEVERHVNPKQKFCSRNIIEMITSAFRQNDFVVVIEDDILIGKDFLNFALWYRDNFRNSEYFGCIGYRHHKEPMPPESWNQAITVNGFAAWGWALFKDKWESHLNFINQARIDIDSMPPWDVKLLQYLKMTRQKVVQPVLSRTNNIGRIGAHMNKVHPPEYFDENIDSKYWYGSGRQSWEICREWHLDEKA